MSFMSAFPCKIWKIILAVVLYQLALSYAQNVTLDDSDASLVFGQCNVGTAAGCNGDDCPPAAKLLDGTWHDCGLSPALTFSFTGTAFYIFGVTHSVNLSKSLPALLTVDGAQTLGPDVNSLPPDTPNVLLGSKTGLTYGKHNVVVGVQSPPIQGFLLFDYVVIDTTPPTPVVSSVTTTSPTQPTTSLLSQSSASTGQASSVTRAASSAATGAVVGSGATSAGSSTVGSNTAGPSPTPSDGADSQNNANNNTESSASSHSNTGAIVGGIIAAVVVLALLGFCAFLYIRRRRKQQSLDQITLHSPDQMRGLDLNQDFAVGRFAGTGGSAFTGPGMRSAEASGSATYLMGTLPQHQARPSTSGMSGTGIGSQYNPYDGAYSERFEGGSIIGSSAGQLAPHHHQNDHEVITLGDEPPPYFAGSSRSGPSESGRTQSSSGYLLSESGRPLSDVTSAPPTVVGTRLSTASFSTAIDPLSAFAEAHRGVISSQMEDILRKAGYQPHLNPDRMSASEWAELGLGKYALMVLRDCWRESQENNLQSRVKS